MSFTDPKPGEPLFGGDTREDVNAMLQKSRPLVMERVRKLRAERNDPDLYPVLIGTIPQFRLTRRMASAVEVDESHNHQWFDDAVTLAGDWREAGPVYAIPYRSLVANERSNLLAAGRCTSSTRSGAEVTRAIPICVATGEAAGTAAAMGCRGEVDLRRMDVTELQGQLLKQGVILDRGLVEA